MAIFNTIYVRSSSEPVPTEFFWWSPEMTSNTTPTPYVVSASSVATPYNYYAECHAFNGITRNTLYNCWNSGPNDPNISIMLDFGNLATVKGIRIYPRTSFIQQSPETFTFEGSFDGINFIKIGDVNGYPYYDNDHYDYIFMRTKYRYYRVSHMVSNDTTGQGYVSIGDIQFLRPEIEVVE